MLLAYNQFLTNRILTLFQFHKGFDDQKGGCVKLLLLTKSDI